MLVIFLMPVLMNSLAGVSIEIKVKTFPTRRRNWVRSSAQPKHVGNEMELI
jgi:hypothetical protein